MTVFVSYALKDKKIGQAIENALLKRDYLVFDYNSISEGQYNNGFTLGWGFCSAFNIVLPEITAIYSDLFWDNPNLKCVTIPNSVIYISSDAFDEYPDIVIRCKHGSHAERYCLNHKIKIEYI